jgi:putative ABC transport system ATP-binding protein
METIVSAKNVNKSYRLGSVAVPALRGVDLEISTGEFICVAGPSGSGKTTLLNLVGCVDVPTSGTIQVAGLDTGRCREGQLTELRLRTIGFIFQSFNLVPVLDVYRNVELPLLLLGGMSARQRRERVLELVERVGLISWLKHRPSELSGGQRQRAAIARALVARPRLVLADEPTANLDSGTGECIIQLLEEMNHREGTTFLFSTHDPRVMAHAQAVITMADGRLVRRVASAEPAWSAAAALTAVLPKAAGA